MGDRIPFECPACFQAYIHVFRWSDFREGEQKGEAKRKDENIDRTWLV